MSFVLLKRFNKMSDRGTPPKVSPRNSPIITPKGTPQFIIRRQTAGVRQNNAADSSPFLSPMSTPSHSPNLSPNISPQSTPKGTPKSTPISSPKSTPRGTPQSTPKKAKHSPTKQKSLGSPKSPSKFGSRTKRLSFPQRKLEEKFRTSHLDTDHLAAAADLASPCDDEEDDQNSYMNKIQGSLELFYSNPNFRGHELGDGAFLNLGFSDFDDDKNVNVDQVKLIAADIESLLSMTYKKWHSYVDTIEENRLQLHKAIDSRRNQIISMVDKQIDSLHTEIDESFLSHLELADSATCYLSDSLQRVNTITDGINIENNADVDMRDMVKDMEEIKKGVNDNIPIWLPLELKHGGPSDYLTQHLFGSLQIVDSDKFPCKFSQTVDRIHSFSTKTKFDTLPPGINDMDITLDGDIIVADKNNKTVKLFDRNGDFKLIIGHGDIKDPLRLLALKHTSSILVTDNGVKKVKMYHKDGEFVCDFVTNLKNPTSICENYRGEILIMEFETKTVHVFNPAGVNLFKFQVTLPSPTYMTVTPSGELVCTDWRNHAIRAYHLSGEVSWKFREKGEADDQITQPQGVHCDPFGHIVLADASNHRIQVFNTMGQHERVLIPKNGHNIKLPMNIKTNSSGHLYVGEYQGTIKIFRYLERVDLPEEDKNGLDIKEDNNSDVEDEQKAGFVRLEELDLSDDDNDIVAETSM